ARRRGHRQRSRPHFRSELRRDGQARHRLDPRHDGTFLTSGGPVRPHVGRSRAGAPRCLRTPPAPIHAHGTEAHAQKPRAKTLTAQTRIDIMNRLHVSDEFDALMDRLDAITPILQENAEQGEELGRVPDESAKALHETGVFKVGIPKELGGYEFSPRQVIDTIAKVSYADASAGWAFMALQMITGTTAAYLGPEAAADLFPDVDGGDYALIAGQGTKLGTAVRTDGGYRISGHWHFASGISMASHIHTAALCEE